MPDSFPFLHPMASTITRAHELTSRTFMLGFSPRSGLLRPRGAQAFPGLEWASLYWDPVFSVVAREDAWPTRTRPTGHLPRPMASSGRAVIEARFVPLQAVSTTPLPAREPPVGVRRGDQLRSRTSDLRLQAEVDAEKESPRRLRAPGRYSCVLLLGCQLVV